VHLDERGATRLDKPALDPLDGKEPPDCGLLPLWLDDTNDEFGAVSLAVFIRYREDVQRELERLGLSPLEAVQRVVTVFERAHANRASVPPETSLRERLLLVAREVARAPNWRASP
jgi:hypothetical protein